MEDLESSYLKSNEDRRPDYRSFILSRARFRFASEFFINNNFYLNAKATRQDSDHFERSRANIEHVGQCKSPFFGNSRCVWPYFHCWYCLILSLSLQAVNDLNAAELLECPLSTPSLNITHWEFHSTILMEFFKYHDDHTQTAGWRLETVILFYLWSTSS